MNLSEANPKIFSQCPHFQNNVEEKKESKSPRNNQSSQTFLPMNDKSKKSASLIKLPQIKLHISNSSDTLNVYQKNTSLLPFLKQNLKIPQITNNETIKFDKFILKTKIVPTSPVKIQTNPVKILSPEKSPHSNSPKRMSVFASKCPFSNPEAFKNRILTKNPDSFSFTDAIHQKKETIEKNPLENLWDFLSKPKFAVIILDFEHKLLKVPQLAKFFKDSEIKRVFEGKLSFFKGNIGKNDNLLNNQVYLNSIHSKMMITDDDFNVFKGFFSIVLREHEIEEKTIGDFLNFLETYRKSIVFERNEFHSAFKEIPNFEEILLEKFMKKIQNNHLINQYFLKKDSAFQKTHCKMIISYLFNKENLGNPGENLQEIHKDCLISEYAFFHFKHIFLQSLGEFKLNKEIPLENLRSFMQNTKEILYFSPNSLFDIGDKLEKIRFAVLNQKTYYDTLTETFSFDSIIKVFLEKTINKPHLQSLFKKFPLEKTRRHAELMLELLLGGPTKYSKCDITPAHYNLKISVSEFKEIRKALDETLQHFKLSENDCIFILSELDYFKYDLCNEKSLLQRMGGAKTIDFVVNSFYLKVFQHPQTNHFFENSDILALKKN